MFWISLPAGALLIALSAGASAYVAASVYAVALALCFGTSAAYHRGRWHPTIRERWQRADHAMIFVLIAGSPCGGGSDHRRAVGWNWPARIRT